MNRPTHPATMPSDVLGRVGIFDRFAQTASDAASRAPFFAACVLMVMIWVVQGLITIALRGDPSSFLNDRYQLEINTTTTIITFLMVALLQNAGTRSDLATQHKLNAVAKALADLMEHTASAGSGSEQERLDLQYDLRELRKAVGLEQRETTSRQSRR